MIYIFGSGGRAKLIKEVLLRLKKKNKQIIFIDDNKKGFKDSKYLLKNYNKKNDSLFIGISDPQIQKSKYYYFKKKLKKIDNKALIDPDAIIKSDVKIGNNTIILENSCVGPNVRLSNNVFIGAGCIINHDCIVEKYTTIGHGSNIAGNVKINENCMLGISTVIKQNITIKKNAVVGCGSIVVKDCKENSTYLGNPAKKIKHD